MHPGVPHEWLMVGVKNCLLYGLGNVVATCAWLEGTMCALAMITGGCLMHIRTLLLSRMCHENFHILSHVPGDKEDHLLNLLHDTHGAN